MMIVFAITTSWCNCRNSTQRLNYDQSGDNSSESSSRSRASLISCIAKPVVVAIAIVSHIFIAVTLSVSVYASFQVKRQPADFRSISNPLSNISIMVAAVDGVLLLVCFVTDAVAFFVAVTSSCSFDFAFIVLTWNGCYALLSILLHSPYIILAYINDASLTGSMSIFYVVTVSSQLLVVTRFYMVCQETQALHKIKFCNKRSSNANYDRNKPLVFS